MHVETKKRLAEVGFDPTTYGLWARHASTAPPCFASTMNPLVACGSLGDHKGIGGKLWEPPRHSCSVLRAPAALFCAARSGKLKKESRW